MINDCRSVNYVVVIEMFLTKLVNYAIHIFDLSNENKQREGQKLIQFFFYFLTMNKHSSILIIKVSYTGASAQRETYLERSTTVKSPCSILNVLKSF